MIKVLIVDDQSLIREGLGMMLGLYPNIKVVGEAKNGREAIESLDKEDIDLVLMDIRMPVMDGVEATKIIKRDYPQVKVLILTTFNEDEYIFESLKNAADGYLLKDLSSEDLARSIETVYRGNMLLQTDVARKMLGTMGREVVAQTNPFAELSKREYEIALLVGQGRTNREIGELLFITEGTVKNHLTRILDKLELRDRIQLALMVNN